MSNYPEQLDTNAELLPVADNATEIVASSINSLREAIFAIQRTLGINPQGSVSDVKTRLDQIINPDGTFKSAALQSAGLIALPITNSMIGSSAAISESKLDLDVPTQTLQSQISSNDIDISALQALYNAAIVALSNHTSGVSQRHDGYDIDISGGLASAPAVTKVSQALDYIYEQLLLHKSADAIGQHPASAITYTPDPAGPFTASNVQDAITQIDTAFQEDRRLHNDSAHQNGIVSDGYSAFFGQLSTDGAALRISRYQPSTGQDQIKLAHINAAAVKSKRLNPLALSSTAQSVDIVAKCGTSTRTLSVTGLHNAQYPAGDSRFSIPAIVDYLNAQFATTSNHFPVQAFDSGDGEIILQHNIDRDDCSITISSAITNNGISALGFSSIDGVESARVESTQLYIDGYQKSGLKEVFSASYTLGTDSSILNLNTVVGSTGLNLKPGNLVHIYNHSNSAGAGTYSIAAVGSPPSTQINLTTTVLAGTFELVIYDDTVHLGTSANPRSVDLYIDSDMETSAVTRYEVALAPISGISIIEVSDGMPPGSGLLQLTTGATNSLQLTINALVGTATEFPSGYIGYLDVFAYDGISKIKCFVSSASLSSITSSITIYDSETPDAAIRLGSAYFNGGLVIDIPVQKPIRGTIGPAQITDEFTKTIHDSIYESSGNGTISGLSTSALSSTQIRVNGGTALISGKRVDASRIDIDVFNKVSANGTWNIVLTSEGLFEIYDDSYAGYSIDAIVSSRNMIAVAQFITVAGSVSQVVDARIFVNDSIIKTVPTVNQDDNSGVFASLETAVLYAQYDVGFGDKIIQITSDIDVTSAFSLTAGTRLECLGSATFTALTLGAGGILDVRGDLTATTITMGNNSSLIVHGVIDATDISAGQNCYVEIHAYGSANKITVTGAETRIVGVKPGAGLLFAATTGSAIAVSAERVHIDNLDIDILNTSNIPTVKLTGLCNEFRLTNCAISRVGAVGSWSSGMIGIDVATTSVSENIRIEKNKFSNLNTAVALSSTYILENILISSNTIENCSVAVSANVTDTLYINDNIFESIYGTYCNLQPSGSSSQHTSVFVTNNTFNQQYSGGSGLAIQSGNKFAALHIDGNVFSGITASGHILNLEYTDILDDATYNVSGNTFVDCTVATSGSVFAIYYFNPNGRGTISSNIFGRHSGAMLSCDGPTVISSNVFKSSSASGVPYYSIVIGQDPSTSFTANLVETSSDQVMQMSNALVSTNYISVGSMEITSIEAGDIISDNYIELTSTSVSSSVSLNYTNPSQNTTTIVNNTIVTNATTNGILVDGQGYVEIIDNIIVPQSSCTNMIYLLTSPSNIRTVLLNNTIHSNYSTVSHSILVEKSSTYISGNTLGGGATSPSTAAININGASLEDIFIAGNILTHPASGTVAVGARKIISNSTKDVTLSNNKNAELMMTYSAIDGLQYDSSTGSTSSSRWNLDLASRCIESSAITSGLSVSLADLPVGAELIECNIYASIPAAIGSLTAQLFERDPTGISATSISAAASNTGTGFAQITVTPSSTTYISQDKEYFLLITSSAINNQIGTIAVSMYN